MTSSMTMAMMARRGGSSAGTWAWAALVLGVVCAVLAPRAVVAAPLGEAQLSVDAAAFLTAAVEDLTTEEIIFGVICMVSGLLMCFFGYATFKIIIFLAGFYMGYWICYAIMESIDVDYGADEDIIIFCTCLGAGLLFGLLLIYLTTVGIFILGALAGFFLACWILSFIDSSAPIQETLYRWIFISGMALVVATIAVCWQKPIIIAASAFLGAYFLFYGIDEFAQTGFAETLEQIMRGEPIPTLETPTILMLAFAAVTAVLGVLVQIRTSRGKDHRQKTSDTVYIQIN